MMKQTPVVVVLLLWGALAAAAEPIERSSRLPETTPWDLAALSEAPPFEWLDEKSPVRALLYEAEPFQGQPTQVFAYYASPRTLGENVAEGQRFPAVVLIHGGGGTAFREWVELWAKRGYAAIAMDLAGCRPVEGENAHRPENRTRLERGGPGQGDDTKFGAIAKPPAEQWPYHAVASAIRAHSLILSFHDVDPEKSAVTGISWGGYLTCIVAGLDSRFDCAVPVYGCGHLHKNSAWLDRFAKMSEADRERWVSLWDPSRYLPAVSMPILFVNGTNDFAYPLDSYMQSYEDVPGEKRLRVTVNTPHGHPQGWAPQEIGLFVDHHLLGAPPLVKLGEAQLQEGMVRALCDPARKPREAALHHTTDEGPVNKRTWISTAAKVDGSTILAAAPPKTATAWFLTAADERGAVTSTRVWLAENKTQPQP